MREGDAPEVVDEDALLPLSALSHFVFCDRRAALIHGEGVWADNTHTVEGLQLHEAVDETARRSEVRTELRIYRSVHLRSLELGVSGVADVVELHADPTGGVPIMGARGRWSPFPVEYKRGKPKPDDSDTVQLCAQGMALEEMLGVAVLRGALFYGKTRRRLDVALNDDLREVTRAAARGLHSMIRSARTPQPIFKPRCEGCSLNDLCKPAIVQSASVVEYLQRLARGA